MSRFLWRGEWIQYTILSEKMTEISAQLKRDLAQEYDIGAFLQAADALGQKIIGGYIPELSDVLAETGLSNKESREMVEEMGRFLLRENLTAKLKHELGSENPFDLSRMNYVDSTFQAWASLGVLTHIAPSNSPAVGVLSVIEGLLTGNINILKTSRKDNQFSAVFLKNLLDEDATGRLKAYVYVLPISSKQQELLVALLRCSDGVAVWGGDTATANIRKLTPNGVRIIEWGHKISFAYITKSCASDRQALKGVAADICKCDQQACSSPQILYFETTDEVELQKFAQKFAAALNETSLSYPFVEPSLPERCEITNITEIAKLNTYFERSEVIEDSEQNWRIILELDNKPKASPLYRTIWLKPMQREQLIEVLQPIRKYLQTCSLACSQRELAEISEILVRAGVNRIAPCGEAMASYYGEPHDGVYALQRYSRRVSVRAGLPLGGIASFTELKKSQKPVYIEGRPILTKEKFQGIQENAFAQLFFKSGGSYGEAKLSVFSYEDYQRQMAAAAEGFFAAGLNPATDRCINLFYAGNLYGSFLSVFSILEHLQAVQYPMAALEDMAYVAQFIVDKHIDTIMGMPSYLIQLLQNNADVFRAYRGIKKLFYGGEHFNVRQAWQLRNEFGIEVIKSAGYGSNDAGPLAYSCPHCEGSIHHVMTKTQYLEIAKLDRDEPVAADEIGRLLWSSKLRTGQNLYRYDIGDLGRWVSGECPCGRKSPRFELLGRHGDLFRAGTRFLSYTKFEEILAKHMNYAGALQLVLDYSSSKERMTLCVQKDKIQQEEVLELIIEQYPDFAELVYDKLLDLEVRLCHLGEFEYSANSGKLRRVIDRRHVG